MTTVPGILHRYAPDKIAFEFQPTQLKKVVIYIAGLMDGILGIPYLEKLAAELAKLGWSLIQIENSSSHIGWGTGSLDRDSKEIGQLVEYLHSEDGGNRTNVALIGYSTGCQNIVHYLTRFKANDKQAVDFGVLQAPVSDRVSCGQHMPKELMDESVAIAKKLIDNGESNELMSIKYSKYFFGIPINAYRWYSLMASRGDDDYFSPDLNEDDFKSTFGSIDVPILVLCSSIDYCVPDWVDQAELMSRWQACTASNIWSPLSHVVEGGTHKLDENSKPGAVEDALSTMVKFVKSL